MESINAVAVAAELPPGGVFAGVFAGMTGVMPRDESVPAATAAGEGSEDALDAPRRRRVLVVDDEAAIRSLITTFLTRAGYEVDVAVDGQEAIDKIQERSYDALVTDLMMPRVDGVGVVRHLQESNPDLLRRTIVLTAYPRLAESEAIESLCSVVAKPFELVNLRGLLNAMFDVKA